MKMLELKEYTLTELSEILGSNGKGAVDKKLKSWGISYTTDETRGENRKYTITDIENPFKVFCILELGVAAQTDFTKLRNCFFLFLNIPDFRNSPDEIKEKQTRNMQIDITRQSISKYIKKLSSKDWIILDTNNYNYYFAYGDYRELTDKETYLEAWRLYFDTKKNVEYSWEAMLEVIFKYQGVPRKQIIPELNAIYEDKLNQLNDLACMEIEKEIKFKSDH